MMTVALRNFNKFGLVVLTERVYGECTRIIDPEIVNSGANHAIRTYIIINQNHRDYAKYVTF